VAASNRPNLLLWSWLLCARAPTYPEHSANTPQAADISTAEGCHSRQQRSDNSCCPGGHFYDFENDSCLPAGPPECAAQIFDSPQSCVPRWCWDLRDDDNKPCATATAGCFAAGRRCTEAETATGAGCPAGA